MSRAYYYCRNFTFAEVNNLYAFGRRDPGSLTSRQRIIRLYRAMLRKQIALNIHSVHNFNIHKFAEDSRRIRDDFDKLWNGVSPKEEEVMMEKYFLYIEKHFDPYMPMHASRKHSNLWGKIHEYDNFQLQHDPFGYYSQQSLAPKPKQYAYTEQYPLMANAWTFTVYEEEPGMDLEKVEDESLENTKSELSAEEMKVQHDRAQQESLR